MRLIVAAVGHRMPTWVSAGWDEFARRMPRELSLSLIEVKPESRTTRRDTLGLMKAEAERLRATIPARCRWVVLDEHGADLSSQGLADRVRTWMASGDDVVLLIGGPDGIDPALKAEAHESIRLSSLTLPHPLVRVVLAEQLYRAVSIIKGHPYHRE